MMHQVLCQIVLNNILAQFVCVVRARLPSQSPPKQMNILSKCDDINSKLTSFSNSSFRSPRETGKEKWDKNSAKVNSANVDENFLDSIESLHNINHK